MSVSRAIQYHAIVYAPDVNGGPGLAKMDLTPRLLGVTWQEGLNLPAMCAFTLVREDSQIDAIDWMRDHLKLYRETSAGVDTIFAGRLVKPQYAAQDVVCLAWDYKSFLQLSRTGYAVEYLNKKLGSEIVAVEWNLAKTVADSPLAFVATGTIDDPLGLDGVTYITTNDDFSVNLFNRLFTFFQIAEMAMANTSNQVVFDISKSAPHTFSFRVNPGAAASKVLIWPGNLLAHDFDPAYEQIRNDRATVITNDTTGEDEVYSLSDASSIASYYRLQDAVTVRTLLGLTSTATEADQLKQAMARLAKEGVRLPKTVTLIPRQGEIDPFRDLSLADTIKVILRDDSDGRLLDTSLRVVQMSGAWTPSAGELIQIAGRGVD